MLKRNSFSVMDFWFGDLGITSLLFPEWKIWFCDLQMPQYTIRKLWSASFEMSAHFFFEEGILEYFCCHFMSDGIMAHESDNQIDVQLVVMW